MDLKRVFLAIVLSFIILFGYQYLFVKPAVQRQVPQATEQTQKNVSKDTKAAGVEKIPEKTKSKPASLSAKVPAVAVDPTARDIRVETSLYSAVIKEQGGGFAHFILKKYRTELDENSGNMELVSAGGPAELPVLFTLDNGAGVHLPTYRADQETIDLTAAGESRTLVMKGAVPGGLQITRTLVFRPDSYIIDITYLVENHGEASAQISPAMSLINTPFAHGSSTSRYLFRGPAAYVNDKLIEIKPKKFKDGPKILQGRVRWAAYEDNYFLDSIVPLSDGNKMVTVGGTEERVRTVISEGVYSLDPGGSATYSYKMYFGPKKLSILRQEDHDLAKVINFGWFDLLAKPTLWLLNWLYVYVGNYGVAIIIITILIKLVFWPITSKGMRSMKNMQKLQPKVAKLKEKYKDDPTKMNQEMMALYKTYKVNPVGGCLPMLIQIPFFFALYRVLMAAIELRHAPFMLWINDLSAPDRLMIGFDIPHIHGIPVLTLLMGLSMYLQQKMTPTTADPTQARIMQFLPVVFTFMFINFASGLVLYWFVNNLLSILQQQLINRQTKAS
jgi:YidC/Oxa1 family membrane protein insertase